jgi:hypothetical protein
MERRKFLKRGSLAALAATLPASSLLAKPSCLTEEYIGNLQANANNETYFFKAILCSSILYDFAASAEDDRKIDLSIQKSIVGQAADYKTYNADYKITSATLRKEEENIYDIVAERLAEKKTEFTPSSDVDFKKLKLTYTYSADAPNSVTLNDKKGNAYLKLDKVEEEFYPEDCFLTTACVTTLGKPDNCFELTTLRNFRDNILMNMNTGQEMIEEYYTIAPAIVKNINTLPERKEVYHSIYNEMIIPVIENIEQHNYDKAVDIYRNYTFALNSRYGC